MDFKRVARITTAMVIFIMAGPARVAAVDIFSWLGMADRPLAISAPDWAGNGSKLRFVWDTHEYYKRWVDNRLVSDFSGSSSGADLTVQLLPSLAVGARKKFAEPQTWKNSMDDRSDRFNLKSEAESGEVFFRVVRRNFAFEAGTASGKSFFTGEYDLHPDIVNALGANPPVYLNNRETGRFARLYGTRGRLTLKFALSSDKHSHRVSASTPALDIVLNHDRNVQQKSAEVSWNGGKGWRGLTPYLRYDDYSDEGDGENFSDTRFKFGNNHSSVDLSSIGAGGVFRYKSTRYFVEYSRLDLDIDLATDFNLITLNPLFLFGTNRVAYRLGYHPDDPWALRLGGQRFFRGIDYFVQYSYAAVSGVATTWSSKEYNMFADSETDVVVRDTTLDLHRMAMSLKRPDKSGNWQLSLNLLVPVAESEERRPPTVPAPVPAPPGPAKARPEESIRGGWQIVVAREFNL